MTQGKKQLHIIMVNSYFFKGLSTFAHDPSSGEVFAYYVLETAA